jgi:hypothetical protein
MTFMYYQQIKHSLNVIFCITKKFDWQKIAHPLNVVFVLQENFPFTNRDQIYIYNPKLCKQH